MAEGDELPGLQNGAAGGAAGGGGPPQPQIQGGQGTLLPGTQLAPKPTPVRTRSYASKGPTLATKKGKTKPAKRPRQDLSRNSGGFDGFTSSEIDQAHRIPCREGCGVSFGSVLEADEHVRAIHAPPRITELNGPPRSLQYTHVSGQVHNISSHHSEPSSPLEIIPIQCDLCQKFFASPENLFRHKQLKHSTIRCPIASCSAPLASEAALVNHIVSQHQSSPVMSQASQPTPAALSVAMNELSLHPNSQPHLSSLAAPQSLSQPGCSVGQLGPHNYGSWNQVTKSGLDRSCSQKPKVHVLWPHECIDSILAKKTFNYKDLNFSALVAGSLASLPRMSEFYQCPESIQVFLQHLSFLSHCHSYSNNTKSVLDYHASILTQIESGMLSWSHKFKQTMTLQRLNFRSSLKELSAHNSSNSSNSKSSGRVVDDEPTAKCKIEAEKNTCRDYNYGRCNEQGDHDGKQHICYWCWYRRNLIGERHPGNNCPKDPHKK